MPPILRHDTGPVRVDIGLVHAMWWALGMDQAPARGTIKPLADRVRAAWQACRDPEDDDDLVAGVQSLSGELPVYPRLLEVDAMQRLRGWHRLRHGAITVEAEYLCEIRNLLDNLTLSLSSACEEELDSLKGEGLADLAAKVESAIAAGRCCSECEWCTFLELRDRCDAALDASGHYGSSYYQAYRTATARQPPAATAAGPGAAMVDLALPPFAAGGPTGEAGGPGPSGDQGEASR